MNPKKICVAIATFLASLLSQPATAQQTSVVAAVLPSSRSVSVGGVATAFATMVNSGSTTATACQISLPPGLNADFYYQATDPTSNAPIAGAKNIPVTIGPGQSQSFLISVSPKSAFAAQEVRLRFSCANAPDAPVFSGLNTFMLTSSPEPGPDIVALAATVRGDGIVDVPGSRGTGFFAVATVNLGTAGSITARANASTASLPVELLICQTNPTSGSCLAQPAASVTTFINAGDTPTFAVFAAASGAIAFDPTLNRAHVTFRDPNDAVRGATGVAVRTTPETVRTVFAHFYFPEAGPASVPFTQERTKKWVEESAQPLAAYFEDVSFGQAQIRPINYLGLFPLSKSKASFQSESPLGFTMEDDARAILDQVSSLANYDLIVLMLPPLDFGYPGCRAFPGKQRLFVNGIARVIRSITISGNSFGCYESSVLWHEVGHTFGMMHSSAIHTSGMGCPVPSINLLDPLFCAETGDGRYFATGDYFDVMGSYRGYPNVFQRLLAGWLSSSQLALVQESTEVILDSSEKFSPGKKGIKIDLGIANNSRSISYYAEYRTLPIIDPVTNTYSFGPIATDSVEIRIADGDLLDGFGQRNKNVTYLVYPGGMLATPMRLTSPGQAFWDKYRGVRFTWLSKVAAPTPQAFVRVERSPIRISVSNGGQTVQAVFENRGVQSTTVSAVRIVGRNAGSFTVASDGCSGKAVPAGASCAVALMRNSSTDVLASVVFDNSDALRPMAEHPLNADLPSAVINWDTLRRMAEHPRTSPGSIRLH